MMVVDKMLLWLAVLSIRFPAQLMGTLFQVSHGIVKVEHIVENSSKQDKMGATLVLQETFMGYQTTSHSA